MHLFDGLDLPAVLRELEQNQITILPGVPSTFEMLSRTPGQRPASLNLRRTYSAGRSAARERPRSVCVRFGASVTQLYGASEIGSVTYNPPTDPFDPASVGYPMPGVSIRILDLNGSASPLPAGREGHVAIRAGSMFERYLSEPAGCIDGYFPTGDLGSLDERGRLFITGRIKLLIDVGGFKVNPLEVEAVLQRHPSAGACAVVAVRQSETVYRLKAILSPRDPSAGVPLDELRQLARANLAAYKVPRVFEVRDRAPALAGWESAAKPSRRLERGKC